ncbi:hypothetical protein BCR39DRAFT_551318 [Naematelia encephala]|uniref:Tetratricopeptide SHNi-TPR domain-containing protein n=1 Tax=Naematelia encephala TaxID=71784 RepID=A0A1Y2AJ21_9TREE|nr:hypothetical protein BCR39DRAFT_551318 [Naematelia encephala]
MSTEPQPAEPAPAVAETTATGSAETSTGEIPETKADQRAQADKLVAEGKKAIALKQWEEGVSKYADALELMQQLVGDSDPQMAPLLLSYGKALFELAFSQQGVMGKEEVDKQTEETVRQAVIDDTGASSSKIVFSADTVPDDDDAEDAEDAQDARGDTTQDAGGDTTAAGGQGGGEEEVDEPEDDYNAAWEVLDVARTIYAKILEGVPDGEKTEERLCLAECYLSLGDVSCETENFPQAVQDYTSALDIKSAILPPSSRALASVHYQLATVLEFTPDRRSDALSHVEKALSGFRARLSALQSPESSSTVGEMAGKDIAQEIKDVQALIGDLEVKIDELKTAPPAEDLVSESINHLLGSSNGESSTLGPGAGLDDKPVNDLTSMVKKKPKKNGTAQMTAAVQEVKQAVQEMKDAAENTNGAAEKRKAEEQAEGEAKRVKAE